MLEGLWMFGALDPRWGFSGRKGLQKKLLSTLHPMGKFLKSGSEARRICGPLLALNYPELFFCGALHDAEY